MNPKEAAKRGTQCMIMEFCPRELFHYVEAISGPLNETEAQYLIFRLLQALSHMHNLGIAHRDIKPENILLADTTPDAVIPNITDFNEQFLHPRIADFGLATNLNTDSDEDQNLRCGTRVILSISCFFMSFTLIRVMLHLRFTNLVFPKSIQNKQISIHWEYCYVLL